MDKRRQRIKYIGLDFLTASVAWLLFNLLRFNEVAHFNFGSLPDFLLSHQVVKGQIAVPFFWLGLYFLSGYYNKPFGKSWIGELFSTFTTVITGSVLILFTVIMNELFPSFQIYYRFFFSLCIIQFALTYTVRALITHHAYRKSKSGEWVENILIIGTGKEAVKVRRYLDESGYHIVGFVGENGSQVSPGIRPDEIVGTAGDIPEILRHHKVDEIVVAVKGMEVIPLLYQFYRYSLPVKVLADKHNFLSKAKVKTIDSPPLIDITDNNFTEAEKNIKWLSDKMIALAVLVLFSPLYIYLSIRIKCSSPGPVFFRQERIGYRGKPFMICKFRTMFSEASRQGPLLTARDDKRVTPYGRFLRKYRLDEIPQF